MLFIVEFILKCEEMLVERNTIPKKSLITASFVFLVNFAIFQQLYLSFHQYNLSLHIQDVLLFKCLSCLVLSLLVCPLLMHVMISLEI